MKRTLIFVFVILFSLSMASCKPINPTATATATALVTPTVITKSFSDYVNATSLLPKDKGYLLEAYASGLLKGITTTDLNSNISLDDSIKIMENVVMLQYGNESKALEDLKEHYTSLNSYSEDGFTTRINVAELVLLVAAEKELGIKYQDFWSFFKNDVQNTFWADGGVVLYPNASEMGKKKDGTLTSNDGSWDLCIDIEEVNQIADFDIIAVEYAISAFDRISSERVMSLYEDQSFRPREKTTVSDVILSLYHYYRWPMVPVYKTVEEVGTYNPSIITPDLLAKSALLPDATNQKLPNWKGFNLDHAGSVVWRALAGAPESWVFESDIKQVADVGGNFVNISIGWGALSGPDFPADDVVNISHMEYLDRIIAWGLKYGVHIQFCIVEGPGLRRTTNWNEAREKTASIFTDPVYRDLEVRFYRMLAKRYAALPNSILSINLMNEPSPINDLNYAETMKPIIEAIREESPDRVLLADIHSQTPITGESMAELGVALCYHIYEPYSVFVLIRETLNNHPEFYPNLTWPYKVTDETIWPNYNYPLGTVYDAKAMMDIKHGIVSLNDVKAIAEKHNVGFMVGEFGFFNDFADLLIESPIKREVIEAAMTDVINQLDEMNIPWCTLYRSEYSLANGYPINSDATYQKIVGSPLYLDLGWFDFYKNIINN